MLNSPVKRIIFILLVLLLACFVSLAWFTAMPLHSYSGSLKPLTADESTIRDDLKRHVTQLAETIGERNVDSYNSLKAAADYLDTTLRSAGYDVHSYEYSVDKNSVRNIEVQIPGSK